MKGNIKLNWWQLAIAAAVVSFVGGLSSGRKKKSERKVYTRELKQAPWAPPPWIFAPAWTLNNYFLLAALQEHLLHGDPGSRKKLLAIQGGIWIIFFTFGYVYFNKKSPVLASLLTLGDASLAAAALMVSSRDDGKKSLNYLPLLLWTSYAGSLSVYQALKNPDPVLGTPQLLK